MKRRSTVRQINSGRGNYFFVDLEGQGDHEGRGPHWFRLPSPTKLDAIIARATGPDARKLVEAAKQGRAAEVLQGTIGTTCALQGSLIGVCWWHPDYDLDAIWNGEAEGLDVYGRAVFEELWEDDYTLLEITRLWAACQGRISASFVEQAELLAAMGFLKAPGPPSGSSTTSAPSTSEIPGAGGD